MQRVEGFVSTVILHGDFFIVVDVNVMRDFNTMNDDIRFYYLYADKKIPKEILLKVRDALGFSRVYADVQGKKYGYYFVDRDARF
jgi:hypothetical protein